MERIFTFVFIFCLSAQVALAQFVPNVGQAFQLAPSYNPSFTGIESYGDLKMMYRYQWVAFADAPKYLYASYYGRLTKPFTPGDQSLRTSGNAIKALQERIPKSKLSFLGMGGQVYSETRGPIEHKGAQFNIAYHYPLVKSWKLSVGISAVIDNTKLRMDKITLAEPDEDELYNRLLTEGSSYTNLNLRPGLLIYHTRFYVGFSYLPLINKVIQDAGAEQQYGYYRAVISSGYSFIIDPGVYLKPSIVGLISRNDKMHFDYSLKLYLRERIWTGIVYRDVKSAVGMVGFMLNPSIGFAYSYERSLDTFNQFNDGSHELVVNVRIQNIKKENPYTW